MTDATYSIFLLLFQLQSPNWRCSFYNPSEKQNDALRELLWALIFSMQVRSTGTSRCPGRRQPTSWARSRSRSYGRRWKRSLAATSTYSSSTGVSSSALDLLIYLTSALRPPCSLSRSRRPVERSLPTTARESFLYLMLVGNFILRWFCNFYENQP